MLGLCLSAGEPVLDGGWRNKLATPIFQQRVRCLQLRVAARNRQLPCFLVASLHFHCIPASKH